MLDVSYTELNTQVAFRIESNKYILLGALERKSNVISWAVVTVGGVNFRPRYIDLATIVRECIYDGLKDVSRFDDIVGGLIQ